MILWLRFPFQKARFWVQKYGFSFCGKWFAVYVPKTEKRIGYMCSVDFDHELGAAKKGNKVFASPDDLMENMGCVNTQCGIYEVQVKFVKVITPERWDEKEKE